MKYTAPRGTKDILPEESHVWQHIETSFRKICSIYNYTEIRTPCFEDTALFTRSLGEQSEVVEKQMYTFPDKKGRSLTLRPEGTAPVIRAVLERNLLNTSSGGILKLFYIGPMFRYERPQAGRERQFYQFGAEAIGSDSPELDAEVMALWVATLTSLRLTNLDLQINCIGCFQENCRTRYVQALKDFFLEKSHSLCADCQRKTQGNVLRILDCKKENCAALSASAPIVSEFLCEACRNHIENVKQTLLQMNISFSENHRLVRGLDYYTRTTFEVVSSSLGAQNALGGGGRYDHLIEEMGGPSTPAVGFAAGIERIILALNEKPPEPRIEVCVLVAGENARSDAVKVLERLRNNGVPSDFFYKTAKLKNQLKWADQKGARFALIVGEEEIKENKVVLKIMQSGEQKTMPIEEALSVITQIKKSDYTD